MIELQGEGTYIQWQIKQEQQGCGVGQLAIRYGTRSDQSLVGDVKVTVWKGASSEPVTVPAYDGGLAGPGGWSSAGTWRGLGVEGGYSWWCGVRSVNNHDLFPGRGLDPGFPME